MDIAGNAALSLPHFPSCEVDTPEQEVILGRAAPLARAARPVLGLASLELVWIHPLGKALGCAVILLGHMLLGHSIICCYLLITTYC